MSFGHQDIKTHKNGVQLGATGALTYLTYLLYMAAISQAIDTNALMLKAMPFSMNDESKLALKDLLSKVTETISIGNLFYCPTALLPKSDCL